MSDPEGDAAMELHPTCTPKRDEKGVWRHESCCEIPRLDMKAYFASAICKILLLWEKNEIHDKVALLRIVDEAHIYGMKW